MLHAYDSIVLEIRKEKIRNSVADKRIPDEIVSQVKAVSDWPQQILERFNDSLDSGELDLDCVYINQNDVKAYLVPFLRAFPNITNLNLYNNDIGSEGCRFLRDGLANIVELNVGINKIGKRGAIFLIEAGIAFKKLEIIRNDIDDEEGIKLLAKKNSIKCLVTSEIIEQKKFKKRRI